jgi:hypothetical protein
MCPYVHHDSGVPSGLAESITAVSVAPILAMGCQAGLAAPGEVAVWSPAEEDGA